MAGKIGVVADRRGRMASKTAGAAEKTNGGSGKMEDMAGKTDVMAYTADGVCDKFAPIPVVGGTRVAQLFAQAGELPMV